MARIVLIRYSVAKWYAATCSAGRSRRSSGSETPARVAAQVASPK
jgi:hypothetical protein